MVCPIRVKCTLVEELIECPPDEDDLPNEPDPAANLSNLFQDYARSCEKKKAFEKAVKTLTESTLKMGEIFEE